MKPLFEWDAGNTQKLDLVRKSGRLFSIDEIESVYDDPALIVFSTYPDPVSTEPRYLAIGVCNTGTVLTVTFVVRHGVIRVFNAWKTKGSKLKQYHGQKAK